jgi:P-type Mg2+ transporter
MENLPYWSMQPDQLFGRLPSSVNGLSQSDAQEILKRMGPNQIRSLEQVTPLGLFLNQFNSPIVLILATIVSAFLQGGAYAIITLRGTMYAAAVPKC